MQIRVLSVGQLQTNCYLVWNDDSPDCFIIDPGDDADFITTEILSLKLTPKAILLTHGHYDHCLACLELKLNFHIPIYLDPKDLFLYRKRRQFKQPPTLPFPKSFKLGNSILKIIPTPGHTPGSVCFYQAPHLFVGDTLFADGVSRTDFSYSSASDLQKSITQIVSYPPNTLVYPGHEETPILLSNLKPVL